MLEVKRNVDRHDHDWDFSQRGNYGGKRSYQVDTEDRHGDGHRASLNCSKQQRTWFVFFGNAADHGYYFTLKMRRQGPANGLILVRKTNSLREYGI